MVPAVWCRDVLRGAYRASLCTVASPAQGNSCQHARTGAAVLWAVGVAVEGVWEALKGAAGADAGDGDKVLFDFVA